ncbi:flagellar protein FliS [Crateriforma conspicua]|uniref:Flagellar protein FliS n=1 Tax=Crateriforma conspicua TaxID=2527996 RepID=A0A5C5YB27_9PLAN|nr:flagellar protein FliS [Crateriforma conspicua]QDV65095.1 flagellar protein FliS [Crateriforma conspicua]TWT70492.1 flagellar protein FliS [Crateriforma conspicua]
MNEATKQGSGQYLESAVINAPPAKLRLMLIEKAVQVADRLSRRWRHEDTPAVCEDSIWLLDLLNELLSGVTDKDTELGKQVSDLYVFLCKHLIAAEETRDAGAIDEIRLVLEVEAETWRLCCARQLAGEQPTTETPVPDAGLTGLDLCG